VRLKVKNGQVNIDRIITLTNQKGSPLTGLPNSPLHDEKPIDTNLKPIKYDPLGIDPESLVVDDKGNFWIGEEYGPSILLFNPKGQLIERWIPKNHAGHRSGTAELPEILSKRKLNGGFEAMTIHQGVLYAFLQTPLNVWPKPRTIPVLAFNIQSRKSLSIYQYPLSPNGKKLGGATTLNNGSMAIIEHNGKTGLQAFQRVYQLELNPDKKTISKTSLVDLTAHGLQNYEKIEGLAVTPESLYIIHDDDFNVPKLYDNSLPKVRNSVVQIYL
jgi:hypothetical protein